MHPQGATAHCPCFHSPARATFALTGFLHARHFKHTTTSWQTKNIQHMEIDNIYNQDCLIGMQSIPDKSIDAIICDLPYGTTRNKWDSVIPLDALWGGYRRIIKPNGAIVLFAQQPFTSILGCSNLEWLRYNWVWEKEMGTGFLNANRAPLKNHEDILVFSSGQTIYNPQMRIGEPYRCYRKNHQAIMGKYNQRHSQTIATESVFPRLYYSSNVTRTNSTPPRSPSPCSSILSALTQTPAIWYWTTA